MRLIENPDLLGDNLDFAGGNGGIDGIGGTQLDQALDGDHVFGGEQFGLGVNLGGRVGVENDLGDPIAVAEVDEVDAAQIAPAVHPAHQKRAFTRVGGAEFPAGVGAAEVAQKIERYLCHAFSVV